MTVAPSTSAPATARPSPAGSPAGAPTRQAARPASTARRAGLTEQAAVTAIEAACRTLHLPTIRDRAADAIAAAERGRHTYAALPLSVRLW